ncbi:MULTISPECIES: glycerophosphodiester phosphodiesterase family protein [Corynebacterium]|uniref:Glycerophosphoryl diester phosphodiesterase family protein n=1 Tax=Corynebacterium simulans TaxID=146827 RepID=A0ABR5V6V5_9CORY|nr:MULTISPECIES: glycerophosphodiester phosphodiesterase family protein [Corynebacterium]KXU17261.1 glycerophosphoryl diester phosphodiesterase family protein [Corynebacterium simulans]OFR40030.1 glycerophosphodiester phosphodiesterase [Corynebacterium sp. HMSC077D03]
MKIVAHRGYSGKYPELSPLAFAKALELPIHGLECDIRLSRDGKVVVNHDATLDRTAGRPGRIAQMDWEELHQVDIGGGQHMLLLDELLEMLGDNPHHLYIETKHPSGQGDVLEEQLVLRLRYAGLLDDPRIHMISFSHKAVRRMQSLAPQVDRFYLRRDWERHFPDVLLSRPTGLGMSLLRAKLRPDDIGAFGLPTYLWTVDKPDDMKWAWSNGIDILATNQPEVALHAIEL